MTFSIPDDVAWVAGSDVLSNDTAFYVLKLPDGQPAMLADSAAVIWSLAAAGEPVVASITDDLGAQVGDAANDVRAFLDTLVANGWLTPTTEEA